MDEITKFNLDIATSVRPCLGEKVSGDSCITLEQHDHYFTAIIDVLGHGRIAHSLAKEISLFLSDQWSGDILNCMGRLNEQFKNSVGAAVGLCKIEKKSSLLRYSGIGNTVIRKIGMTPTRLVSQNGILGSRVRHIKEQTMLIEKDDIVLLYTDGIKDHFNDKKYPQIHFHNSSTITGEILKKFSKPHDDAACIAIRFKK